MRKLFKRIGKTVKDLRKGSLDGITCKAGMYWVTAKIDGKKYLIHFPRKISKNTHFNFGFRQV